jgi:tetratricopeptide (TPR) repeat protein
VQRAPAPPEAKTLDRARAYHGLGYAYTELGQWDNADKMYRKALAIDSNDPHSLKELQYIQQRRNARCVTEGPADKDVPLGEDAALRVIAACRRSCGTAGADSHARCICQRNRERRNVTLERTPKRLASVVAPPAMLPICRLAHKIFHMTGFRSACPWAYR